MVQIGLLLIVLTIGAIVVVMMSMFNVKVTIYEQVSLGIKVTQKKARKKVGLDGNQSLMFLFSKELMPLPPGDFFFPIDKKKYALSVYRDRNGQLHPIKLRFDQDNKAHMVSDDRDVRAWYINQQAKINAAYNKPTQWQNIATVLMIGGAMAFALAVVVVAGHYYTQLMQNLAGGVGGQLSELTQALHTLPTSVPTPSPPIP